MNISVKLWSVVAGSVATLLALTSCSQAGGTSAGGGAPQVGGDLVMVRASPVLTLLPTRVAENGSLWMVEEMYDSLLIPSVDGKSVEPNLATKWTQSANKLSWTFSLRHGVRFSNGAPMTSKDVKFSLEQAVNPSSPFGFINQPIATVAAPDEYTVVITTKKPCAALPSIMSIFQDSVVPYNYGGVSVNQFAEHPIGTGPFKLDHWTKGKEVKLVKNPRYWKKNKPYLNSVTFSTVADANTRANEVQGGQAQINEFPPFSSVKSLEGQTGVKVGLFPGSNVDFLAFNTKKTPLNDVHVRRAIADTIDKSAIIKAVLFGHGQAAGGYMSSTSWSYDPSIPANTYSMTKAKQELAQSSQPHGFSATISVLSGDPDEMSEAEIVQTSAAKIGIKITLQVLDPSAFQAARDAGNYEMSFAYDTTDIVDPDEIIRFTGVLAGGSNALDTFYDNKKLASLAEYATTLDDQNARKQVYDNIQAMFSNDMPAVPLYYSPSPYSWSSNVHNFHPSVTGNYNLVDVWLSK